METWKIQQKTHGIVPLLIRYYLRTPFFSSCFSRLQAIFPSSAADRLEVDWPTQPVNPMRCHPIRTESHPNGAVPGNRIIRPTVGTTAFFPHPSFYGRGGGCFTKIWNGSFWRLEGPQNPCDILEGALFFKLKKDSMIQWPVVLRGDIPPPSEPRFFFFHSGLGKSEFWLARIMSNPQLKRDSKDPGDQPSTMLAICKMDGTSPKKSVDDPESWHCDAEFRNNLLLRSVVFPYFSLVHCYSIDSCRELTGFPKSSSSTCAFLVSDLASASVKHGSKSVPASYTL